MLKALSIRSVFSKFAVIGLAMLGAGCAADSGVATLNVHRDQTDEQYVDNFDRALFTVAPNGQVDLILLANERKSESADTSLLSPGGGINPGMKQVIHMRVLWQPTRTIKLDSPSATNAVINWHVIAGDNDRLAYTGACWAMVNIDGDEADIDLRNATVRITKVLGNVQDPLKRANLAGKFTAVRSDAMVRAYMNDLVAIDRPAVHNPTTQPLAQIAP